MEKKLGRLGALCCQTVITVTVAPLMVIISMYGGEQQGLVWKAVA